MSNDQSHRTGRSRRVRALLAGGVVLGVGAVATLAAWNDSEYASGTFSAGTFNLQGSTTSDSTGYADHESAGGAASLAFTLPLSGNLTPGDTVYAPMWVRLAADTTSPATLDLVSIDSTDITGTNSTNLTYSVYALATPTSLCDASATSGILLGTGSLADNTDVQAGTTDLPVGVPTTNPGTATKLCFVATAGPNLQEGGQTTATWQLTAQSN